MHFLELQAKSVSELSQIAPQTYALTDPSRTGILSVSQFTVLCSILCLFDIKPASGPIAFQFYAQLHQAVPRERNSGSFQFFSSKFSFSFSWWLSSLHKYTHLAFKTHFLCILLHGIFICIIGPGYADFSSTFSAFLSTH